MRCFTKLVNTSGLMAKSTMVNGLITKWKVKVPLPGATAVHISENTRMTKSMDTVHLNGLMAESTSESGLKANNMDKVLT